jgi:hypothetical protein
VHSELHCAANRRPEHIGHEAVSEVPSAIALADMENGRPDDSTAAAGMLAIG